MCIHGFCRRRPVAYSVNNQPYEGYYVSPSAKAPLVLLIHDWDGLTDYEVRRAHMLADLGYAVFAADLFGAGVRPTEVKDKRRRTGELYKDREKIRALIQGAMDSAKARGANVDNAVVMGVLLRRAAVLEFAGRAPKPKVLSPFTAGWPPPKDRIIHEHRGRLLVLHGTADTAVTMDQFARLAVELEENNVPHEMTTYSGAPHAFTVFGSGRYRKMSTANRGSGLQNFWRKPWIEICTTFVGTRGYAARMVPQACPPPSGGWARGVGYSHHCLFDRPVEGLGHPVLWKG